MASSRDAGHHRESMGLHPTPCTEQPVNRDLQIPVVCLSGFFSVGLSANCSCPIHSGVPAFLGALLSWRHFFGKSYWLAADYEIIKVRCCRATPFIHRIGESPFRKVFQKFFLTPIGIGKGRFIYSFLKFSKFHIDPRGRASWLRDEFHRANRQKRTVLHEGMGSRIPIKMPGMKSPNGILSYSGRILP